MWHFISSHTVILCNLVAPLPNAFRLLCNVYSGIWLGASCIQSSYEDILQNSAPVFGQLVGSLMLIFTVVWIGMAVFGVVLFIMVCMCLVVGSRGERGCAWLLAVVEREGVLGC